MNPTPLEIIHRAMEVDAMDAVLLGKPGYCYRSNMSPASGGTDLTEVLAAFSDSRLGVSRQEIVEKMMSAIEKVTGLYEGIEPVATVILVEALSKKNGKPLTGIPLDRVAGMLKASISFYHNRLQDDKSGDGRYYPDGMLGDIRRLSKNTVGIGGPSFCE